MIAPLNQPVDDVAGFISTVSTVPQFSADKISGWLSAVLASSMDGVIVIDTHGTILLLNHETERMFAYDGEKLLGRSLDTLLPARLHDENQLQIGRLAATRVDGRRLRLKLDLIGVRSSGEEFVIDAAVSRVTADEEMYLVLVLRELAPRNVKQEQEPSDSELRKLAVSSQQQTEIEKKRFSKELYDDLGQCLSALNLDLKWLQGNIVSSSDAVAERIAQMQRLLSSAIIRTKDIASTLRPPLLDDFGLMPAIEWMAENFYKKTGIACIVETKGIAINSGDPVESAIFRVIQESLLNVERHAHATQVRIVLKQDALVLNITVQDNGIGMHADQESKPGCFGLLAMQERVYILGGTMSRTNIEPTGFAIHVSIPVDQSSNFITSL